MAEQTRVRSRFQENSDQVRAPVGRCLVKRRVSPGLGHIDIRALFDQQSRGLTILAQGHTRMQRLVVQGIPRETMYMRAVGEQ